MQRKQLCPDINLMCYALCKSMGGCPFLNGDEGEVYGEGVDGKWEGLGGAGRGNGRENLLVRKIREKVI